MPKYILQELPEEMTDGKKIVFPKMQTYSLHDYETVIDHMRDYAGSISEGMIKAVFDALVSTMKSWMPMGHNIKIDGLGVFSLTLGFDESSPSENAELKNVDDDPKPKYRHVCIKGINFKPDPKLLQALNKEATFERGEAEVQVPQKTKLTREERITRAKAIIQKNGFMTLYDYANATHQSRSVASKDLRQIVADLKSGITTRGSHSHKVWIANDQLQTFYAGGNVYCATKAAVKALSDGLRIDVANTAIRVTNLKPGLVETNFSNTRFRGDNERAANVYKGIKPLTGDDIADVAVYAANAPEHVQIAEVLILATHQASGSVIVRK